LSLEGVVRGPAAETAATLASPTRPVALSDAPPARPRPRPLARGQGDVPVQFPPPGRTSPSGVERTNCARPRPWC